MMATKNVTYLRNKTNIVQEIQAKIGEEEPVTMLINPGFVRVSEGTIIVSGEVTLSVVTEQVAELDPPVTILDTTQPSVSEQASLDLKPRDPNPMIEQAGVGKNKPVKN